MRVWKAKDDEAIALANDTIYGLSGYIYTESRAQAEKLAPLMQAGSMSHNDIEYSRPHNPFGGYKMSGFRNRGEYGFRDACHVKAVCLRKCRATGTHAPSLYRLMRALASLGVPTEDTTHQFALTPLGEALRTRAPGSAHATILTLVGDWMWRGMGTDALFGSDRKERR